MFEDGMNSCNYDIWAAGLMYLPIRGASCGGVSGGDSQTRRLPNEGEAEVIAFPK